MDSTGKYSLMGIVNLTDNSFVASSRCGVKSVDELLRSVGEMIDNGADIIDVGGCSTAPGNEPVSEELEWKRMEGKVEALFSSFPATRFSIDSFRSGIIVRTLALCGPLKHPLTVNDVSSGDGDARMLPLVVSEGLPYVAMDSTADPHAFFVRFSRKAEEEGLYDWILDPGFGFGKTLEQNWDILNNLERLLEFGRPVLAALSRKRMIYVPAGLTPDTCAALSVSAEKLAVSKGASIIRTHDLNMH